MRFGCGWTRRRGDRRATEPGGSAAGSNTGGSLERYTATSENWRVSPPHPRELPHSLATYAETLSLARIGVANRRLCMVYLVPPPPVAVRGTPEELSPCFHADRPGCGPWSSLPSLWLDAVRCRVRNRKCPRPARRPTRSARRTSGSTRPTA